MFSLPISHMHLENTLFPSLYLSHIYIYILKSNGIVKVDIIKENMLTVFPAAFWIFTFGHLIFYQNLIFIFCLDLLKWKSITYLIYRTILGITIMSPFLIADILIKIIHPGFPDYPLLIAFIVIFGLIASGSLTHLIRLIKKYKLQYKVHETSAVISSPTLKKEKKALKSSLRGLILIIFTIGSVLTYIYFTMMLYRAAGHFLKIVIALIIHPLIAEITSSTLKLDVGDGKNRHPFYDHLLQVCK